MKNSKLLIIIPARSGSSRIKNKNLRKIGTKSLLEIKIKTCLKVKNAKTYVSTNSKKIANKAIKFGALVPYLRPKKYSTSRASTLSCVLDLIRFLKKENIHVPEYIGIFPPTNPFLKTTTINKSFRKLVNNREKINSIIGFTKATDHPFQYISFKKNKINFNLIKYMNKKYSDLERTQDWPKAYVASSSLKIVKTSYLMKYEKNFSSTINYKTFDINSSIGINIDTFENFDINDKFDLIIADLIYKTIKNKF
tara:strand:+ start:21687 stop:22442 length:756 start_codon:yes stop_codon:yes gene_type:complete